MRDDLLCSRAGAGCSECSSSLGDGGVCRCGFGWIETAGGGVCMWHHTHVLKEKVKMRVSGRLPVTKRSYATVREDAAMACQGLCASNRPVESHHVCL